MDCIYYLFAYTLPAVCHCKLVSSTPAAVERLTNRLISVWLGAYPFHFIFFSKSIFWFVFQIRLIFFFFFLDSQFLVCFEKRPYSVLPAGLKLSSFPLEPPKSVNYKCVPPCLGLLLLFLMEVMPQFAFSNIF